MPPIGAVTSPAVMLSPKARNFVSAIFGDGVSVIWNEHDAVRFIASVAVHSTVVTPTGKLLPLVCVHDTETGVAPASTRGAPKMIGPPASDVAVSPTLGGHAIDGGSATIGGGSGGGGVGVGVAAVGELQPLRTTTRSALSDQATRRPARREGLHERKRDITSRPF